MDPVSLIVAAVVAGATAGLKEQAQSAVRDAYEGLKRLIVRHRVDVSAVERQSESAATQESLRKDLAVAGVGEDDEVLKAAHQVVKAVREHDAAAAGALSVELTDVEVELVRIVKLRGGPAGIKLDRVRAPGGVVIEDIDVGGGGTPGRP